MWAAWTPQILLVYGSLHLICAVAAARDSDRAAAATHISKADAAALKRGPQ